MVSASVNGSARAADYMTTDKWSRVFQVNDMRSSSNSHGHRTILVNIPNCSLELTFLYRRCSD